MTRIIQLLFFGLIVALALSAQTNGSRTGGGVKNTYGLLQGNWIDDLDSLSSVTVVDSVWTFNYVGEPFGVEDEFKISIVDSLPEFTPETRKTEFMVLANKTDTMGYKISKLTDKTLSLIYYPSGRLCLYHRKK
jgi:hypothetical protein